MEGPRPQATEALLKYIDRTGAVYASHLWHPLFIEGLKTLAFELAEQLDWSAPAAVVCPVGAGSILLGLYRGFLDLQQAGLVTHLPRLIAVQAEHVSPLHQAFHAGLDIVPPAASPLPTRAEGIALPRPVRDREVINALRQSAGTVIAVSEEAIVQGLRQCGPGRFLRGAYFGGDLGRPAPSPGRRSGGAGPANRGRAFGSRPEGGPTHRRVVGKRRVTFRIWG